MNNYSKIKAILQHGQMVEVYDNDTGCYSIFSSISGDNFVRHSEWATAVDICRNTIGKSEIEKKDLDEDFKNITIRPIPVRYNMLKVGDKVDVLEELENIKSYDKYYDIDKVAGKKNLSIQTVVDQEVGQSYGLNECQILVPAWAVVPHIEEKEGCACSCHTEDRGGSCYCYKNCPYLKSLEDQIKAAINLLEDNGLLIDGKILRK